MKKKHFWLWTIQTNALFILSKCKFSLVMILPVLYSQPGNAVNFVHVCATGVIFGSQWWECVIGSAVIQSWVSSLVKLSVCWPCMACGEWSKWFSRVKDWGWGQGLGPYPSLISLLSDLYLINTPSSEKYSNTYRYTMHHPEVTKSPLWISENK